MHHDIGEPVTWPKLAALALTFARGALIVQIFAPAHLVGNASGIALELVAAASYATYSVLGKRLMGRHGIATVLASYLLLGALCLIALKLLASPATWPAPREGLTTWL
jgi:drug/metabolite transporter (DMT)-like permease